jgi:DNA-binding response OmpR family regulator
MHHATADGSDARGQRARGAEPMGAATPIVIVDDDAAIAEVIRETCEELPGCVAVTVADGVRALSVIEAVEPALVILDVDLPGLDGFAVYDRLSRRPATAGLPVLFTSANDHPAEFARRGVRAYLPKPFDLDDLLAHVRSLLGRRADGDPARRRIGPRSRAGGADGNAAEGDVRQS